MKRIVCSLAILFLASTAFSQRVYFIYLESEQAQPFFVKMGEQVYSSTSSGYLILSKLKDSIYNFTLGFPQEKYPEQSFKVEVRAKDKGFLLKNFGDKGWGLFDLQTLSVQMGTVAANKPAQAQVKEVSLFTDVLAKAANDPSLRETPIKQEALQPVVAVKKEPEKEAAVVSTVLRTEEPVKKETTPVVAQDMEKEKLAREKAKADSMAAREALALKEKKEKDAQKMLADSLARKKEAPVAKTNVKDTAPSLNAEVVEERSVTISGQGVERNPPEPPAPVNKQATVPDAVAENNIAEVKEETRPVLEESYKPSVVKKRSESSTTEGFGLTFVDEYADGKKDTIKIIIPAVRNAIVTKEQPTTDKRFLDITTDAKEDKTPAANSAVSKPKPACTAVANESDFLKLRKRMAAKFNDDEMTAEAVKTFKTKCFTVFHLRNLSTLFLTDSAKYKFFNASKEFVSDRDNFGSLQAELKEEAYVARFKEIASY